MAPMPSWSVALSGISEAMWAPIFSSTSLIVGRGISGMGWSTSTKASTSETWMQLPWVRGICGLISAMVNLADCAACWV